MPMHGGVDCVRWPEAKTKLTGLDASSRRDSSEAMLMRLNAESQDSTEQSSCMRPELHWQYLVEPAASASSRACACTRIGFTGDRNFSPSLRSTSSHGISGDPTVSISCERVGISRAKPARRLRPPLDRGFRASSLEGMAHSTLDAERSARLRKYRRDLSAYHEVEAPIPIHARLPKVEGLAVLLRAKRWV